MHSSGCVQSSEPEVCGDPEPSCGPERGLPRATSGLLSLEISVLEDPLEINFWRTTKITLKSHECVPILVCWLLCNSQWLSKCGRVSPIPVIMIRYYHYYKDNNWSLHFKGKPHITSCFSVINREAVVRVNMAKDSMHTRRSKIVFSS